MVVLLLLLVVMVMLMGEGRKKTMMIECMVMEMNTKTPLACKKEINKKIQ